MSFRREKYVPRGGPDGGDGGKGGDVVFIVRQNLKTLSYTSARRLFRAEDGQPGQKRKRHGRDGEAAVIPVPPGTILRDPDTGAAIKDLTDETEWTYLRGGKGGQGNAHFATSTRQAPRYAQPGLPGVEKRLLVELSIIADIGLVGMPNAGKSTLLRVVTNARPEVGAYPFTTKFPNLGVMRDGYSEILIADIPGLIAGASLGHGLGDRFLKHISRTTALAFLIDLSEGDPGEVYEVLLQELREFDPELLEKPRILVGTKLDLVEDPDGAAGRLEEACGMGCTVISAHTHSGLDILQKRFMALTVAERTS